MSHPRVEVGRTRSPISDALHLNGPRMRTRKTGYVVFCATFKASNTTDLLYFSGHLSHSSKNEGIDSA
jgi:hypothetical protein